mgnify:FL=1|jgi:hypothetical protein
MNVNNAINVFKNIVGVEIATIQDVVKAQSAGLYITGKDGWGYDYDIEDEEDDEKRTPTEQEIFDRITKALATGEKVYACMTLANDLCVTKDTNTIIQSNFFVNQKVYTMHENKIMKGEIIYLSLSCGKSKGEAHNALLGDMAEKLYYFIGFYFTRGRTPKIGSEKEQIIDKIRSLAMDDYVVLKTEKGEYLPRLVKEIFESKETLVEDLMKKN